MTVREPDDEQRSHSKGDGKGRADPADHRAAGAIGLDRQEVGAGARSRRDQQPDREREQEPAAADARLRHRSGSGRDEQRHEHAECDQLAEGEMHNTRETENERVSDRDETVDGARREPAR